jgi:RNA polymerase sigma-70 factor (ECF subfamily)
MKTYQESSDDALMVLYADGDSLAFEELFRRHAASVFSYLLRATNDRALAEDLFQATFLHLHRSRKSYRAGFFKTFLFTIATNLLRDERSGAEHKHRTTSKAEEAETDHASDAVTAPSPEAMAVAAETGRVLEQAIAALPEGMREVVLLSRYHGLSNAEIAGVLGISQGAVKVRLFRALTQLRVKLALHAE